MPRKTMIEAIRDAMDVMMARDDNVVVFGEDVGFFGGVFRCTQGLQAKYGKNRCFDAPINESGIVGAAVGMAAAEMEDGRITGSYDLAMIERQLSRTGTAAPLHRFPHGRVPTEIPQVRVRSASLTKLRKPQGQNPSK